MIDVPATGKGAELVPGNRVATGPLLMVLVLSFASGHVNLAQTLVDRQQRRLQLFFFGVRVADTRRQLVVLVLVVVVQVRISDRCARADLLVHFEAHCLSVADKFHLTATTKRANGCVGD